MEVKIAENILYDLWYSIAEKLFARIVKETGLDTTQEEALRSIALRPNDFHISVEDALAD